MNLHLSNFLTADIRKTIFCTLNHQKRIKFRHVTATTIYYPVHCPFQLDLFENAEMSE